MKPRTLFISPETLAVGSFVSFNNNNASEIFFLVNDTDCVAPKNVASSTCSSLFIRSLNWFLNLLSVHFSSAWSNTVTQT